MDRHWGALLYIFKNNGRLTPLLTTRYFDLDNGIVHIRKLREASKGWTQAEKFMLDLALHLFNQHNKVNLSDMDSLDSYNTNLAIEAIRIRFQ
ncbi:hypothetical protein [Paenibacillus azoreducens]|uniref:Uncharacterized protein n=1 Tax=Paenibacillus azoreducens TaxID=116718 RepID=A0A919YAJ9_9BACL|nr:hypothetical protein [Paenibacillus azoreducens]GIO48021.1 hypothetical protein J34TS1_27860 [Paenibacillus azoreducens]